MKTLTERKAYIAYCRWKIPTWRKSSALLHKGLYNVGMFRRWRQMFVFMALSAAWCQAQQAPAVFNAQRIKLGTFTYRDLEHRNEVGRGIITIKTAAAGKYVFRAKATFAADFQGFHSQQWETVATTALEPVSAKLAFVRDSEISSVFDLEYNSGSVTGFVIRHKEKQLVSATVPTDIVDQRIDWAAILSSNLEPGRKFEFSVYDPGTGISRVAVQVDQLEEIRVPAGSFRAYRVLYQIEKAGTTEHYQILVSQDSPHMMLREEFPNGIISELVHMDSK
ncbi:MAG TPA: hypothetical protein VHT24_03870 [Pseudacidobacterium sp.]|nr:hypothetical protein [Pseudacidobacterium sp.]